MSGVRATGFIYSEVPCREGEGLGLGGPGTVRSHVWGKGYRVHLQ